MGVGVSPLKEEDRRKLDGIVQQMISNNEPEENIRFVVEDFKTMYAPKKKVGSIAYPELESETPSTSEGSNPFSYRQLSKPKDDKDKFIKPVVPQSISAGVKKDKTVDTGTTGYIFNTIVDGVSKLVSGAPDAINAVYDAGDQVVNKILGTPGFKTHPAGRMFPGVVGRLPEGQEVRDKMGETFKVSTEYKPPEFDVTDGVQASDVKSLAVQAPGQLLDMVYGAYTGGGSFFLQAVSQNTEELNKNPNAEKLSPIKKLGYIFTQATGQAVLDKVGLNKILKSTGLSAKVQQKITNEVIDEFRKKGIKATSEQIEQALLKKASSLSSQIKKVGLKAATSFGAEGGTEAAQQALSDGIKMVAGSDVFDTKDITTNFVKNVINAGVQGGAFGGVAGGSVGVLQNTNKAIRSQLAKAQTPEDIQKIQADIAEQVELGNITEAEANAANISAQQYAEIAGKIPMEIDAETKYALIGGIEQRNDLEAEIEASKMVMSTIDPAFHAAEIDKISLLNAKLEQTNDYIDGIVSGKKTTYKKDGDGYFKTDANGQVSPISQQHYELATAIREEESNKKKQAEASLEQVNPEEQKTFTFTHDENVPNELEGVKPISIQEIETEEGPKIEATYSGKQLIDAGLAKKEITPEEIIKEEAKKGTLAGGYSEMVQQNPDLAKDVLVDYAKQKYGLTEDGNDIGGGGREITNKEVDNAVTKAYPTKESVISAIKESTPSGIKESKEVVGIPDGVQGEGVVDGGLVITEKTKDVLDEVSDEKIGEKKYQDFSIDFKDGARAFGTIEDGVASITGINASKNNEGVIRGTKTYERVLEKLNEQGVKTVKIKLQSNDSSKAIDKLVEKGILKNPRNTVGSSGNERPTTFDISPSHLKGEGVVPSGLENEVIDVPKTEGQRQQELLDREITEEQGGVTITPPKSNWEKSARKGRPARHEIKKIKAVDEALKQLLNCI